MLKSTEVLRLLFRLSILFLKMLHIFGLTDSNPFAFRQCIHRPDCPLFPLGLNLLSLFMTIILSNLPVSGNLGSVH